MPTGLSSTSSATSSGIGSGTGSLTSTVARARRAVADVAHLVRFRTAAVRRKSALRWALAIMGGLTVAACTVPMALPGAHDSDRARDVLLLIPTAFVAFLLLTVVSAVASGGGRELLSREQGVAFPVSPTTDHLGALLLAPLNIAWLLQAWLLLGTAAYALSAGPAARCARRRSCSGSSSPRPPPRSWPGASRRLRRRPHGIGIVRLDHPRLRPRRSAAAGVRPARATTSTTCRPSRWSRSSTDGFGFALAGGDLVPARRHPGGPGGRGGRRPTQPPVGHRATRPAWRVAASPREGCPRPPSA